MSDEDLGAPCVDCGVETLPLDENRAEWYHVGPDDGCLCVGCLEHRLQRKLVPADFSDAGVNNLSISDTSYAWTWRTPRLVSRIKGES